MREYKTGRDYYVFDPVPYEIEADMTGIDNLYVQEELYDDYLELNPSLEGILRKKNFLLKAVQETPWEEAMRAPEPVSIVVDTTAVSVEFENGGEGYSFTPKEFTTNPVGYEQYVTVTVGGNEYEEEMLLTEGTYTVTYSLEDGDGYTGDTASYTITVSEAALPISIVVDTTAVSVEFENGGEGYAFTPKEFTTSPTGYEEYVTVTVGESEYYEGMTLTEGTYTVTYTLEDGDGYVGDTASYTITVAEAALQVSIVVDNTDDTATATEGDTVFMPTPRQFTTSPTGYENDVVVTATLEETSETITADGLTGFDIESLPAGTYTITISYDLAADQAGTHTSASASYTLYLTIESAASYHLTYTYDDNTMTASCTGVEESDVTSIEIPDTVEYNDNTYTVTTIGNEAFKDYTSLTDITLTSSLTNIGESAFKNTGITELHIPENVTVGTWAFMSCLSLETVEIAQGVNISAQHVFNSCSALRTFIVHSWTPPTIHQRTFYDTDNRNCTLHVPEGRSSAYQNSNWNNNLYVLNWQAIVDDIPILNYEFDEDNNTVAITGTDYPLSVINIPKTVTKDNTTYTVDSVGGFSGKTSITEVNFPTYVSGDDDITVGINGFSGTHVISVHIPENIVSSGYMFYNCTYLDQVVIEDGSYNFGGADFGLSAGSGTSPITQFILMHTTPPQVSSDLFLNTTPSDAYLYVPTGTLSDYEASGWNNLGFAGITEGILQAIFPPQFGSVDDPQPLEIDITNQQQTYGPGNAVFDLSDIPLPTVTCNDTQGWHWTCEITGQTSGGVITVNTTVTNGVPVVTGSTNPNDGQTYQSVPCDLTDTWTIEYYFETESNDDGGMPLASDSRSIEIQFIDQNA